MNLPLLQRAQHDRTLGAHGGHLLGFQTLSELVDLASGSGHSESYLAREEVGMFDDLALEAELLSPVEHRLIEGGPNELAGTCDHRARFERLGVALGGFI